MMFMLLSYPRSTPAVHPRSHPVPVTLALSSPGLSDLVERARFLRQLDAQLRAELPANLSAHVQVANLYDDRLVMLADSSAWATRLRYERQKLLHHLWRHYSIRCPALEVKVSPANF
jgi:hypothetical protein